MPTTSNSAEEGSGRKTASNVGDCEPRGCLTRSNVTRTSCVTPSRPPRIGALLRVVSVTLRRCGADSETRAQAGRSVARRRDLCAPSHLAATASRTKAIASRPCGRTRHFPPDVELSSQRAERLAAARILPQVARDSRQGLRHDLGRRSRSKEQLSLRWWTPQWIAWSGRSRPTRKQAR